MAVDADGILILTFNAVLNAGDVDAFFGALSPIHADVRAANGRVRALLETMTVQSPIIALQVRSRTMAMARPEDRVAIVFGTMLAKLQIQRLIDGEMFAIFTHRPAALDWLRTA